MRDKEAILREKLKVMEFESVSDEVADSIFDLACDIMEVNDHTKNKDMKIRYAK